MKKFRLSIETRFYIVFFGILLISPVFVAWLHMGVDDTLSFNWHEVFVAWNRLIPYIVVFLFHNFLMAPLLQRGHRAYYLLSLSLVVVLFFLFQCRHGKPDIKNLQSGSTPPMEMKGPRPMDDFMGEEPMEDDFMEDEPMGEGDNDRDMRDGERGPRSKVRIFEGPRNEGDLHVMRGQREFWDTLLLVLMLGMNIAVKLYARQREDARRMEELERRNLEQQLAQLRYQVNPHFLMNILNNIHALVDIDPVEAQQAIIELSRLLRYVLYDADRSSVLLRSELDFIQHYVALMRVRYADSVQIDIQLPSPIPEAEVPPLLFITFVENAFKHGVSYQQLSTIKISITLDDESQMLEFTCVNTKRQSTEDSLPGGVGLRNVRQRLNLLYPDCHSLDITDGPELYTVQLKIPLRLNTLDKPA